MSAGRPAPGSNTAPVLEVIREGETGFLTDFFDHAALAEKLNQLPDDAPFWRLLLQAALVLVQ